MGRTRRIRFNRIGASNWADSDSDPGSGEESDGAGSSRSGAEAPASEPATSNRGGGNSNGGGQRPVRYLCYFAQSLLDFRVAEVEALAEMAGCPPGTLRWEPPAGGDPASPFWFVTFPSRSVARHVASRAVLLRALIEVWGEGPGWPQLQASVEAYPPARRARFLAPDTSFRLKIDTWNFKWREERKNDVLDALEFVGFQGRVDLSDAAQSSFWVILAAPKPPGQGWDAWARCQREREQGARTGAGEGGGQVANAGRQQDDGGQQQQQHNGEQQQRQQEHQPASHESNQQQHSEPEQQQGEGERQWQQQPGQQQSEPPPGGDDKVDPWTYIYFGREVAIAESRALPALFSLKQRRYLGPTSMDAEMAFVMANMACVRAGHLVLDPFCGTGSVLLAAAKRGAHVVGGDIDMRVLKQGRPNQKTGAPEDNFSNFEQYGLTWPAGLLRMDASRAPFRAGLTEVFDAIIADPPYGVRAGGRKSAPKEGALILDPATHYVATAPYGLTECVDDLVAMGARLLRPGGRLVFFVPVSPETYDPSDFPDHPAMALAANSEQPLSTRYSRRLLTFRKSAPFDAAQDAAWREGRRGFKMGIEQVADQVWEPAPHKAAFKQQRPKAKGKRGQATGSEGCGGGSGSGGSAAADAAGDAQGGVVDAAAGAAAAAPRAASLERELVGARM